MMPILYWFKNDLWLHDNEGLYRTVGMGKQVLCVYCIDPNAYSDLELGFRKADEVRHQFLLQCLGDVRNQLQDMGGSLLVVQGSPSAELPKFVDRYQISAIFAEEEHAEEELKMVGKVKNALPKTCDIHLYWGRTMYHQDDIPYSMAAIPLVSKTYRIKTTKETKVRECLPQINVIDFYPIADYGELPKFWDMVTSDIDLVETEPFVKGGEREALKRLQYYFYETEKLTAYKWTRNKSLGMDYSSKFSPYLALGCISPRYIYHEVKKYEEQTKKKHGTWWFLFQLVCRDYFIFRHMRVGTKFYAKHGFKGKKVGFEDSKEPFERRCEGKTGIPFVYAHMRKLNATGYMGNRGRVNYASFLIHDYKVDWRWRAAYFESKLIDYDVSVNWMNWHMQAFEIWYTNPIYQSYKYKEQEYIRKWLPKLAELDDRQVLMPWEFDIQNYPKPGQVYAKWQRSINTIKKTLSKTKPT